MPFSVQNCSYMSPMLTYDESVCMRRIEEWTGTATGTWNRRRRFWLSFLRDKVLDRTMRGVNHDVTLYLPVEHAQCLENSLFPAPMSCCGHLDSESRSRAVVAVHGEPLEAIALSATVLELRSELLQLDEGLIVVFLLIYHIMVSEYPSELCSSYLCVLAWNLDVVVLPMRVLDQVETNVVQTLNPWATVQELLEPVPVLLKASTILG